MGLFIGLPGKLRLVPQTGGSAAGGCAYLDVFYKLIRAGLIHVNTCESTLKYMRSLERNQHRKHFPSCPDTHFNRRIEKNSMNGKKGLFSNGKPLHKKEKTVKGILNSKRER